MIGSVAIIVALLFIGGAIYRFAPGAPPSLRRVTLVAALLAAGLGVAHWIVVQDSRWLVGAILLLGAAYPGWAARNRRGLAIAALVLGVLGTILYGIATMLPTTRATA